MSSRPYRLSRTERPVTKSTTATRGTRHELPGGKGPSEAPLGGKRKSPTNALEPPPQAIISASTSPGTSLRALGLGRHPGTWPRRET